jgi:O-antigen/teichoic acid export membrane protein
MVIYLDNVYKNIIGRVGLTGLTNIFILLSGFILLPVLTRNLTIEEYGIWVQLGVTTALLSNISVLGLHGSIVRFLGTYSHKKELQEGFYSILFIVLFTGIIISIIFYYFSSQLSTILFDNNIFIARMVPLIVIMIALNAININFFRAFNQIKLYNIFSFSNILLQFVSVYYFVAFGYGIFGATIGLLISQILFFFIMFIPILLRIQFKIPKYKKLKEYLSFSLPLVPTDLYSWLVKLSDRYIIGIILGIAYVGYYSPSYNLSNIILMFSAPINLILFPTLSKHFDNGNFKIVENILKYSLKYFLACSIPSAVLLSLFSKQILLLLTTPDIAMNGYIITPFVTISAVFFGAYGIIVQIIYFKKKTNLLILIWFFAGFLNVILNFILIPHIGILGAGISTLIAYSTAFGITIYYSFKYFKFNIDLFFIIKSIVSTILMTLVIFLIDPCGYSDIIIVTLVSIIVYIISLYLMKGFNTEEFQFLKRIWKL